MTETAYFPKIWSSHTNFTKFLANTFKSSSVKATQNGAFVPGVHEVSKAQYESISNTASVEIIIRSKIRFG